MAEAVTNMLIRLLNTDHSPENVAKLVNQFLTMAIRKKLKLDLKLLDEIIATIVHLFPEFVDPCLLDEIIATIVHHFPEFVDPLDMEDTTELFTMAQDLELAEVQPLDVPKPSDGNRVENPTIDLSMDEKVDDNIEFVPTSDKLHVINQSAEINLPTSVEIVSKFSEFTVVTSVMPYLLEKVVNEPKEKIYESEVEIHDFVATPTYTIKTKPIEEVNIDVEMTEAEVEPGDPVVPITELSPVELETAQPKTTAFKVRNLDNIFSRA
nr:protein zds1-like [Ipomoea batatas]